ncbi:MAG: phosphopentomutase [Deltaproteobacteria bacterium]|nr:phosphopentomutase [Deltaproteobacteria bacterium]
MSGKRAFVIVLDSVGCGALPDAGVFGDEGADTLGHVADAAGGLALPHLGRLGLGNVHAVRGVPPGVRPAGGGGRMGERSPGKDTTTGHWEIAGVASDRAFPTFPGGFPPEIMEPFAARTGRGVLGNKAASGTSILEELGAEHQATGKWIVYTSADSVFQVAAHTATIPLAELYRGCEVARGILDPFHVGRVIARPFEGPPGAFRRTYDRRDYAMPPPRPTVLDGLAAAGVPVIGVGKIHDIFAGRGVTESIHTEGNDDGCVRTIELARRVEAGLVFVNLVDFDSSYGHRNDARGYARALESFDRRLGELLPLLRRGDLLLLTADHGCDPTTPGTDHTREHVPLLAMVAGSGEGRDLGTRATFADAGATVAEHFGVKVPDDATSFLGTLEGRGREFPFDSAQGRRAKPAGGRKGRKKDG